MVKMVKVVKVVGVKASSSVSKTLAVTCIAVAVQVGLDRCSWLAIDMGLLREERKNRG